MDNNLPLVSYALVVLSGICFVGGLVILSSEGRYPMCTDSKRYYQY